MILVGQYRFPLGEYSWEIPEGGGLPTTTILESAQRELIEEFGVNARRWIEILGMDLSNSVSDERGTAFLAWDLTDAVAHPEGTEQLQIARVPFWRRRGTRQAGRDQGFVECRFSSACGFDEAARRFARNSR